ncbi:hypothetical protein IQ255_20655 [Pleurocapsales cyanobacterium LEGE 10410]|nr:hypothetical protein [Pleurocapsales cyanobacterium LEGE 10410]
MLSIFIAIAIALKTGYIFGNSILIELTLLATLKNFLVLKENRLIAMEKDYNFYLKNDLIDKVNRVNIRLLIKH